VNQWPYKVEYYSVEEVGIHCVRDSNWQSFRKSLKGLPTSEKLQRLDVWRNTYKGRPAKVQIDNYINALKRGGQLGMDLTVRR